jgi:stage IV sporulation protein FB
MNLFEDSLAPRTRFDLNFRLGDVPVRVHPYFWLSTLLLGLDLRLPFLKALLYLSLWAAIVFVSILVHELGHVLMGRYYGSRGHIILTGFCGLAVGSSELPERRQRIAVSLAGPGAGFLLAAVVTLLTWLYNPDLARYLLGSLIHIDVAVGLELFPADFVVYALSIALWINVFWGLVNLLPLWPLDGGQICREICQAYRGREGMRIALQISVVTAGILAVLALIEFANKKPLVSFLSFGGSLFPVLFFGLLALSSWQLLQVVRRVGPDFEQEEEEPRQPWERDADWWKQG